MWLEHQAFTLKSFSWAFTDIFLFDAIFLVVKFFFGYLCKASKIIYYYIYFRGNGPSLQSYLFQECISLNSSRVELNYTILYKKKWLKLYIETKKRQLQTNNKVWELFFDDNWFHFWTYPYFETITAFQLMSFFWNISWFWDNYSNSYQCQFLGIYKLTSQLTKQDFLIRKIEAK